MTTLEDFPEVHEAYQQYVAKEPSAPRDATQLSRWAKRFLQKNLNYSNVNKYLRITRGEPAETPKAAPPKQRSYNRLPRVPSAKRMPPTRSRPQSVISRPPNGETQSSNSFFEQTRDRGYTAPPIKRSGPPLPNRPKSPSPPNEIQEEDRPHNKMSAEELDLESPIGLELWLYRINYGTIVANFKKNPNFNCLNDIVQCGDRAGLTAMCAQVSVGPVYRPKLINHALELIAQVNGAGAGAATEPEPEVKDAEPEPQALAQPPPGKRKSVQMNRAEDIALTRFRATLRNTTLNLKQVKKNKGDLDRQKQELRAMIGREFDEMTRELGIRKAALLEQVDLAHSEWGLKITNLEQKMTESARALLGAKRDIESRLAEAVDDEQRQERSQYVVNTIEEVLQNVPQSVATFELKFQSDDGVRESVRNYGTIQVESTRLPDQEE